MSEARTLLAIQGEVYEGLRPHFGIGWNGIDYVVQGADWRVRQLFPFEGMKESTTPPASITIRGPMGGGRLDETIIRLGNIANARQHRIRKSVDTLLATFSESVTIVDEHAARGSERTFCIGKDVSGGIAIDVENPFDSDDYERRDRSQIRANLLIIPEGSERIETTRTVLRANKEELYILSEVYRCIREDVARLTKEALEWEQRRQKNFARGRRKEAATTPAHGQLP